MYHGSYKISAKSYQKTLNNNLKNPKAPKSTASSIKIYNFLYQALPASVAENFLTEALSKVGKHQHSNKTWKDLSEIRLRDQLRKTSSVHQLAQTMLNRLLNSTNWLMPACIRIASCAYVNV